MQKNSTYRGDRMCWLQPAQCPPALQGAVKALLHLQQGTCPWLPWFFAHAFDRAWSTCCLIWPVVPDLAMWGYDVGGRSSIQLSMYPGNGARYGEETLTNSCPIQHFAELPFPFNINLHIFGITDGLVCIAVRHTDASDSVPNRTVTAILYLNPGWDAAKHGGQLCVYTMAERWRPGTELGLQSLPGFLEGEPATVIAPLGNRVVVFESNLAHEVLPAESPR